MIKNVKRIVIIFLLSNLIFQVALLASSEHNRALVVHQGSRDEAVEKIFREMMQSYEEKDLERFFSYISEDRFVQDYMTFYEAVEKDMREYDTLSIDTWVEKITDDGVKRFLYVRWEKRYERVESETPIEKLGYSRFLFDEINGEYKLIELAGNNFWGESLVQWREEVPKIAGQEKENQSVDLFVTKLYCNGQGNSDEIGFEIINESEIDTSSGVIEYLLITDGASSGHKETLGRYNGDIEAGERVYIIDDTHYEDGYCSFDGIKVIVNPTNIIPETDYSNNCQSSGSASCTTNANTPY